MPEGKLPIGVEHANGLAHPTRMAGKGAPAPLAQLSRIAFDILRSATRTKAFLIHPENQAALRKAFLAADESGHP